MVDDGDLLSCGGVIAGIDLALWIVERGWASDSPTGSPARWSTSVGGPRGRRSRPLQAERRAHEPALRARKPPQNSRSPFRAVTSVVVVVVVVVAAVTAVIVVVAAPVTAAVAGVVAAATAVVAVAVVPATVAITGVVAAVRAVAEPAYALDDAGKVLITSLGVRLVGASLLISWRCSC